MTGNKQVLQRLPELHLNWEAMKESAVVKGRIADHSPSPLANIQLGLILHSHVSYLKDRPISVLATGSLPSEWCQTMPDLPSVPLCSIWCQDEYKSFDEIDITNILHLIHRTTSSWEHRYQIKESLGVWSQESASPLLCLKGNGVTCSLPTL